jgi:hypothetical protein
MCKRCSKLVRTCAELEKEKKLFGRDTGRLGMMSKTVDRQEICSFCQVMHFRCSCNFMLSAQHVTCRHEDDKIR